MRMISISDIEVAFKNFLAVNSHPIDKAILFDTDSFNRYPCSHASSRSNLDVSYIAFSGEMPGGYFKCWHCDMEADFSLKHQREVSNEEWKKHINHIKQKKHSCNEQIKKAQAETCNKAKQLLNAAQVCVTHSPGEGLAEIGLLKKILANSDQKIHYLAIDSSQKLLRDHIGLLKEVLMPEIESGQLICAGIVADIFSGLREAVERTKHEFNRRKISDFLPQSCSMLVTYLGNCLGNNYQDQETEFFSMVQSIFQNRPLEILTGVSVMRAIHDEYIRNWDDFLLQTPRHLMHTRGLLESSRNENSTEPSEFMLPADQNNRCPPIKPETYIVRHGIKGQIYRFYYKLAFDLDIAKSLHQTSRPLPKGTLILLHSIIKYDMQTLVRGIEASGLFKVKYDPSYHQVVNTSNGTREYAIFSAYLEGNNNEYKTGY